MSGGNRARAPGDATLAFLDVRTGRTERVVSLERVGPLPLRPGAWDHGVSAIAFAPDGRLLAATVPGGHICICDARSGAVARRFQAHPPSPRLQRWKLAVLYSEDFQHGQRFGSVQVVNPFH